VLQSPHYLRYLQQHHRSQKVKKKEKIVYVQKKIFDRVRMFNNMNFPLTWYFEFQKKLLDYFEQETNFDFIYKLAQGQAWAENALATYITDKKSDNLFVFKKHFLESLRFADRVIVDHPSGAFYEAVVSKKPVLCLYADYIDILPEAEVAFGKVLRRFSSMDEAIYHIKEFLYGNPQHYIACVPFSNDDVAGVFHKIIAS
jgi:hypothetical protein